MSTGSGNYKHKPDAFSPEEELDMLREKLDKLRTENDLLKKIITRQGNHVDGSEHSINDNGELIDIPGLKESFFNQVPFMMWVKDVHGRFIRVNAVFARQFGKIPDEITGLTDFDFNPRIFAEKFRTDDAQVMQTGKPVICEEQIPLHDGFRWHETIKIPLFDDNKKVIGTAGFAKDITDRKNHEDNLRLSEEKFRELAENTTDSFILSSGHKIVYVNPAFEQVYGYTREELMRDPDLQKKWIHPSDRERILDVMNTGHYKYTYIFNEQYRIIKKDGTVSWIWNRSYPVWNNKGEAYRIVTVTTNISGVKILEERLTKSQSQQQAILDNIPHLAWLKDIEGEYVSVNESFCRFFNLSSEEIMGKTDYFLCKKELADDYVSKDQEVIRERKSKLFFEVEEGKFGKRYSETHKTPIINDEGEVIGIAGISRDITEQKLAEQALLRSEEKFKDLVTLLPEVVFETNAKGKITFVNLKGSELMGYSQAEVDAGMNVFDVVAPEDVERARHTFIRLKKGNEIKGNEYKVITKTGKKISVLVFTNNMYHEGRFVGVRGVMVDITRRKKAENQEKEYQTKLLFLSNTALDFLGLPNEANIFRYIGSKLKEFISGSNIIVSHFDEDDIKLKIAYHSLSSDQSNDLKTLLGVTLKDLAFDLSEDDILDLKMNAEHLKFFEDGLFETGFGSIPRPVILQVERIIQSNKVYGMALMRSGKLYGSVLILSKKEELHDKPFIETFLYQASIALHRRQLEQELVEAKIRAEESDKLKTSFLANMSHEIRTPMNGILGLAQLLTQNKLDDEERTEYLSMIGSNGKLLMNLVNDIIDISRIESNQVDLNEGEFSLNDMMSELLSFIQSEKMVKNKDKVELKMITGLDNDNSAIIADQSKLKQVLTNLIGNAIKFTLHGTVEFGYLVENDSTLKFFVKDSGIGISADKLQVIFDRFTQVDQSLTRPFGGSGLGLAISKGFVERMGGTIWAESELEKGAAFYFTIPYKYSVRMKRKPEEKKQHSQYFNWEDISILVVEDNYVSFKLLEISLSKTGVGIIHAADGQVAIDKVKEHPEIDIVLMDIQLPVLNGYDATAEIKRIRPDLPVIAQTANAMDDDRLKCLNAGCSDYITKPIVLDKLYSVINNYVIGDK
ncbi:MAG TPA: PAS domain S-box protein [Bacteroidales bacterium]|nr:PAS domain S-box protein [Bacteroidales bacterium]